MAYVGYFLESQANFLLVEGEVSLLGSLQDTLEVLVMIRGSHLHVVAFSVHQEVICDDCSTLEVPKNVVHSLLELFWGRGDAKGHAQPAIPFKGCVERGSLLEASLPLRWLFWGFTECINIKLNANMFYLKLLTILIRV